MRAQTKTVLLLALLAALSTSCKVKGEQQPFTQAGANAEALRETFNADVGKVRLIVLVAPT